MRKHWVIATVLAIFTLAAGALGAAAEDKKKTKEPEYPKDKYASVKFVVVKDRNGKPIRNASVVLHEVNKDGHEEHGGMQLKTDEEGRTKYDGIPYGKVRIQVIARGFQTYGQDHVIDKAEVELNIRMKAPADQVTIYENKDPQKKPEEKK